MGRRAAKKLAVTDADIAFVDAHYGLQAAKLRHGRKLSKREGDLNMEALRQKYTPEQLTGKLAKLAGLRPTDAPVTAIELAADFSWDKVPRADIPIPPDF